MMDRVFLAPKKYNPHFTEDDIEAFKYTFSQPGELESVGLEFWVGFLYHPKECELDLLFSFTSYSKNCSRTNCSEKTNAI